MHGYHEDRIRFEREYSLMDSVHIRITGKRVRSGIGRNHIQKTVILKAAIKRKIGHQKKNLKKRVHATSDVSSGRRIT